MYFAGTNLVRSRFFTKQYPDNTLLSGLRFNVFGRFIFDFLSFLLMRRTHTDNFVFGSGESAKFSNDIPRHEMFLDILLTRVFRTCSCEFRNILVRVYTYVSMYTSGVCLAIILSYLAIGKKA